MAAAFELTRPTHRGKYQVTVYQVGWRLGGKGASGRGPADRIEEHGIHIWMGFYENAFRLLRECYAELNREFHFTLYQYSRSPLLMSLMRLLWASLHGGPRVLRTHAESARQHDAILDALRAGDADAASALTHEHIMGAERATGA